VSRRTQIAMTDDEVRQFLADQRVVTCASIGHDGWPHLAPLWYVLRDGRLWAWTYAASQKARNLERDPRASLQVEAGDGYDQLRGVLLRTTVTLHRDPDALVELGSEIFERYHGTLSAEVVAMVRKQAAKRVGLEFVPAGPPATWDHRKLGGTY
jgi:PPOX class probable F420-dependent enzyme